MHVSKQQSVVGAMHSSTRSSRLNLNCSSAPPACVRKQPVCGKLSIFRRSRSCSSNVDRRTKSLRSVAATPFTTLVAAMVWRSTVKRKATCGLLISALFEKFTEQAIKGIMASQRESKALGSSEVGQCLDMSLPAREGFAQWHVLDSFRLSLNIFCLV